MLSGCAGTSWSGTTLTGTAAKTQDLKSKRSKPEQAKTPEECTSPSGPRVQAIIDRQRVRLTGFKNAETTGLPSISSGIGMSRIQSAVAAVSQVLTLLVISKHFFTLVHQPIHSIF